MRTYSRGLAGTVLVYKIAGAFASRGADLNAVYDVGEWVSQRIGTIGVGLDHCHVSHWPRSFGSYSNLI